MAKKKEIKEEVKDLKSKVLAGNGIFGVENVLKALKNKKLSKIFLADNCPQKISEDVAHYAGLSGVPIVLLDLDNEELGIMCKKNFFVSVVGIT